MSHPYGHNPYGAMYACQVCGARFRTVERLRAHEDDDGDLCAERAALRSSGDTYVSPAPGLSGATYPDEVQP